MNIQTDRALVPAGTTAVRYLTVTITAPARARQTERGVNPALDDTFTAVVAKAHAEL